MSGAAWRPTEVSPIPAFPIADIVITNPATYEDYKQQVAPLIVRFGGQVRNARILPSVALKDRRDFY